MQFIYVCTILSVGTVGSDNRQSQLIVGISEGLAYVVAQITIPRIKRRLFVMFAMSSAGVLCLGIALLTMLTD